MTTATLFIRADADARLGSGHLVRCSAIGKTMRVRGWRVILGGMEETIRHAALQNGFDETVALPRHDAPPPPELRYDAALVDHYRLGEEYERVLKRGTRPVAALDDLRDRAHAADILIDPRPGAPPQPGVKNLLGANAAPLRPAFAQARQGALAARLLRRGKRRIFLSFGAFDPQGASVRALDALRGEDVDVDVAVNPAAPSAGALQAMENERIRVFFDPDADLMVELMRRADVGLGAPGSTTWERCCLGLPSAVAVVADNQRLIAETLGRASAAVVAEDPEAAARQALALLDDEAKRRAVSDCASGLCDGRGAERIADAIEEATDGARHA